MDVRFYDRELNLVHIEPFYQHLDIELEFNGIGTFEMCIPPGSKLSALALEGEYLAAHCREQLFVITSRRFEDEKTVLYGRTANFLLKKRVVFPFAATETDTLEKFRELMTAAFPDIIFESESQSLGVGNCSAEEPVNLYDLMYEILEDRGLGHSFTYDINEKKWVFRVLESKERGLLLSESLLNMYSFEKTLSVLDAVNCGYYLQKVKNMGTWDPILNRPFLEENPERVGEAYMVRERGNCFGITWYTGEYLIFDNAQGGFSKYPNKPEELYVFVGGEKTTAEKMECMLEGESLQQALKSLSEKKEETDVVAKVKNVTFGKDYFLGDKVNLRKKTGEKIISEKVKITGVSIWLQNGNEGEMPRFSGEE